MPSPMKTTMALNAIFIFASTKLSGNGVSDKHTGGAGMYLQQTFKVEEKCLKAIRSLALVRLR